MFYKSGKVISHQFEPINMFLFGELTKTGVAEGGFPYSHITLSQNVNIFVKTKNAPEALKHKINLNFFVTLVFGVPILGGEGGICLPLNPVFL